MTLTDYPLQPFMDALPIPTRRVVSEPGRLTIPLLDGLHRYHRDLPESRVWTFDGTVPGPTIEVGRGVPLEVRWENRLTGRLPVVVTRHPHMSSTAFRSRRRSGGAVGRRTQPPRPSRATRSSTCTAR